jgi:hypothetical protein
MRRTTNYEQNYKLWAGNKLWAELQIMSRTTNYEQNNKLWAELQIMGRTTNYEQNYKLWAEQQIMNRTTNLVKHSVSLSAVTYYFEMIRTFEEYLK